jgi:hypothetical protein
VCGKWGEHPWSHSLVSMHPFNFVVTVNLILLNSEFIVWYECGIPASCTMGTGGPFPGGKARPGRDADHSPPSSTEVENEQEL